MWNWPDIFKIWSDNVRWQTVISSPESQKNTENLVFSQSRLNVITCSIVPDAKCRKISENELYLVLVSLLIGWKSGTRFLSQSGTGTSSIVNAKPIDFQMTNENRSVRQSIDLDWPVYGSRHRGRYGAVVRVPASQCGLGSILALCHMWLSLLLVLVLLWGFFTRFCGLPHSTITSISKFQFYPDIENQLENQLRLMWPPL